MTTQLVSSLRNKYYAGDASLEEEKLLKQLLEAPDAPAEWKAEAELMELLSTPPEVAPPAGFERRILERLQREPSFNTEVRPTLVKRIFRPWVYATAVAAAMMGFVFIIQRNMEPEFTVYADTCHTAEEARTEIENALLLVANTLILDDVEDDLGGPCD